MQLFELITILKGKHIILMGDFNYRDVDWNTLADTSPNSKMFDNCLEDNFLIQHVKETTRNEFVLDLVITSEPDIIQETEVLGKFMTSDHNLLHWSMDIMVNCEQKKQAMLDLRRLILRL